MATTLKRSQSARELAVRVAVMAYIEAILTISSIDLLYMYTGLY